MKIKEIIVVEGKDDTVAIKRSVNADTIETNGSAVDKITLESIKHAHEKRGVIIFTDPDYPGKRIRNIVSQYVPGCKHAFLPRHLAVAKNGKGLGIEHASPDAIRQALKDVHQEIKEEDIEEITWADLLQAGLVGGSKAKLRREKVGILLKIGYANGKQFHKRLKMFQISKTHFGEVLAQVLQEEK
jgi:ribonuclease M5